MCAPSLTSFSRPRALGRRYWLPALLALTLWADIAGAVNLWRDIGRPFGGYAVMNDILFNRWQIDEATPPWWPGVNHSSLKHRDTLVSVDGNGDILDQGRIYQTAFAREEETVEIVTDRRGLRAHARVPILIFTARHYFELKLPDLIIGLSFWLLALMIYRLRPAEPLNRAYAVIGALGSVLILGWRHSLFRDTAHFGLLLGFSESLGVVGTTFISPAAVYAIIMLVAPSKRDQTPVQRATFWIVLGLALPAAIMLLASRTLLWINGWTPLAAWIDVIGYGMALSAGAICGVFVLSSIVWTLVRRRALIRVRKQMRVALVGLICAIPAIILNYRAGLWLPGSTYCCGGLDLRYLYLALPLAFAFVILRYQAFRGTHPVFVLVMLLSISALLASIGDWLVRQTVLTGGVGVDAPGLALSTSVPPFVPILAVVLAAGTAGVFLPRWLSRLFRWESTSYGAVRQFGQEMIHRLDLTTLPEDMVTTLAATLQLDQAGLWLRQPDATALHLVAQVGAPPDALPEVLSPPSDAVLERPAGIGRDAGPVAAWLQTIQACGFEAVTPLRVPGVAGAPDETWLGLLALGKRVDEEIFHVRDLEIIDLIGQQAALFLLTAQQIERLREVPRRVTEAQERERFRLAQELHDTIQQFLGRLPFYLQVSSSNARSRPEQTEALLQRCIADVENAARTVRQIRGELAPIQLESKLAQPLMELLEHFRTRTGLAMNATIPLDLDALLSSSARHALYRVLQQALDNVEAHANGASRVEVMVRSVDRRVEFSISDDGCGFTEAQRVQAETDGHFGLRSMQARTNSLGGELTISSGPDQGVILQGWLPVDRY